MDRSNVIQLISITSVRTDKGIDIPTETKRTVFAKVTSVSAKEFFEASQNNIKPQLRFIVFAPDYNDELLIEFEGKRYSVYRTYYGKNDSLELMAERKVGNG